VVTDIEMPGPRNGLDLAEHIKTRRPWSASSSCPGGSTRS
jgi:YesN/AraC family two-component response regulator